MNETITALENAIQLISKASFKSGVSDTGMLKALHAQQHLERQLAVMIAE